MDTYGYLWSTGSRDTWTGSDEHHINFWLFWVFQTPVSIVFMCYIQSAAPDSPAYISNNQGACLLLRVLLFGQSSAFRLSWAVLMRSDWSLFCPVEAEEHESSRERK
ncbi:uncharacterized protein P174DRAFT_154551 [Aspergillus novofumigatus IBT 16806]|uniref:Uncharacterized protein n=1 Tax=Aspergillus novofumigatus (strain IBT 16806) TaxID=1392255 RepID=A0A2I1CEW4_ASPN1|nr:uncharacterized protein P174DRAFT_154551 [Aspergillus novofumigatus IBT 16806]PKX96169.1 hypothetical protein P174DRAFT_154551 [Aspergillus novofumigatus IBT 16806]